MDSTRRKPGRRPTISDDELVAQADLGLSQSEIARHFTALGRPISQQRVGQRLNAIREGAKDRESRLLPWVVRTEHAGGHVYLMVVALAKREKGLGITPYQLQLAKQLEKWLREREGVMTYDYEAGFQVRNRRPTDGDTLLTAA